jgi:hypothetical protein
MHTLQRLETTGDLYAHRLHAQNSSNKKLLRTSHHAHTNVCIQAVIRVNWLATVPATTYHAPQSQLKPWFCKPHLNSKLCLMNISLETDLQQLLHCGLSQPHQPLQTAVCVGTKAKMHVFSMTTTACP